MECPEIDQGKGTVAVEAFHWCESADSSRTWASLAARLLAERLVRRMSRERLSLGGQTMHMKTLPLHGKMCEAELANEEASRRDLHLPLSRCESLVRDSVSTSPRLMSQGR